MENKTQRRHIDTIFWKYVTPSSWLQTFTVHSNAIIQTVLSSKSKFVFEILRNADEAFDSEHDGIDVEFFLQDDILIVNNNGKGFDAKDIERICNYELHEGEFNSTFLSCNGWKSVGFKSVFNLSSRVYIYSNGYSFRFDKSHWSYWTDAQTKPWQIIPLWCDYGELPICKVYSYDKPVNFIVIINNDSIYDTKMQLIELIKKPELLLFLNHINKLHISINGEKYSLERRVEKFYSFDKIEFYKNEELVSTWILKTYYCDFPSDVKKSIQEAFKRIYPDNICISKAPVTFALKSNESLKEISKVSGVCYSTLPSNIDFRLPYHVNSVFTLNLTRSTLKQTKWNEFLVYQIGQLQLSLLKELAEVPDLKNYVMQLVVLEYRYPYDFFVKAFKRGFWEVRFEMEWLPAQYKLRFLKLYEAWSDETEFFKNFPEIQNDYIKPNIISYDVLDQRCLFGSEVKRYTYFELFEEFPQKYYHQLTKESYKNFISYLYEKLKNQPDFSYVISALKRTTFLVTKEKTLVTPKDALLQESDSSPSHFSHLNIIDNDYLPSSNTHLIKEWLIYLGAKRLVLPI